MSRQQSQKLAVALITLVAVLVFVPVILILFYVIYQGISAISWEFLTPPPSNGMKEGGIMPAIVGTLILTIGTAIVSMPISIAAAIYLSEYAKDTRLTRTIRMAIINLAGIPSIVYGLFGLGVFVLAAQFGTSILAGALTPGRARGKRSLTRRSISRRRSALDSSRPSAVAMRAFCSGSGRCSRRMPPRRISWRSRR